MADKELLQAISTMLEQKLKTELDPIKSDMQLVKKDIRNIELTLEQETNRNINIVAEGHADLNRRLDEALRSESEKEMLLLRVNRLENELRKIKERLEVIA